MPTSRSSSTSKKSGFTLVELLVVISIIAILSVIGVTVFTNVQKSARDAKRKADINAITKAYEQKYLVSGTYGDLTPGNNSNLFTTQVFPKDPSGSEYTIIQNNGTGGFRICTALEDSASPACSAPSDTCFCKASVQADPPDSNTTTYLTNRPPPDNHDLWFGDKTHFKIEDCTNLKGWVCDKDYPKGPLTVSIYDGPKADGKLVASGQTTFTWPGTNAADVCGVTAQNTGFSFTTPAILKDGKTRILYYYGLSLNTEGQPGLRGEVGGSSEPFKCPR